MSRSSSPYSKYAWLIGCLHARGHYDSNLNLLFSNQHHLASSFEHSGWNSTEYRSRPRLMHLVSSSSLCSLSGGYSIHSDPCLMKCSAEMVGRVTVSPMMAASTSCVSSSRSSRVQDTDLRAMIALGFWMYAVVTYYYLPSHLNARWPWWLNRSWRNWLTSGQASDLLKDSWRYDYSSALMEWSSPCHSYQLLLLTKRRMSQIVEKPVMSVAVHGCESWCASSPRCLSSSVSLRCSYLLQGTAAGISVGYAGCNPVLSVSFSRF